MFKIILSEEMGDQQNNPRVKVYFYFGGDWREVGIGHIKVNETSKVSSPETGMVSQGFQIIVISENEDSKILTSPILMDTEYNLQEDTILIWTEGDMQKAISFSCEKDCSEIQERILNAQMNLTENYFSQNKNENQIEDEKNVIEDIKNNFINFEIKPIALDIDSSISDITYPEVNMETLDSWITITGEILETSINISLNGHDKITKLCNYIIDKNVIDEFLSYYRVCDDLQDLFSLFKLFQLFRNFIAFDRTVLFEKLLSPHNIMDVIGCLEYDPSREVKVEHRKIINETVKIRRLFFLERPENNDLGTVTNIIPLQIDNLPPEHSKIISEKSDDPANDMEISIKSSDSQRSQKSEGFDESTSSCSQEAHSSDKSQQSFDQTNSSNSLNNSQNIIHDSSILCYSSSSPIPFSVETLCDKATLVYRIQYLIDKILPTPSIFDDKLNQIVSYLNLHKTEICTMIYEHSRILENLFEFLNSNEPNNQERLDCVLFLHEFCGLSSALNMSDRDYFFDWLKRSNIINSLTICLDYESDSLAICSKVVAILTLICDHKMQSLREYIMESTNITQDEIYSCPLIHNLIMTLHKFPNESPSVAIMNILVQLLETETPDGLIMGEDLKEFSVIVFKISLEKLFSPMKLHTKEVTELSKDKCTLIDKILCILCRWSLSQPDSLKKFISDEFIQCLKCYLKSQQRFIICSTLRFFRRIISLKSREVNKLLLKNEVMEEIITIFKSCSHENSMLNNCIIELIDFIRTEEIFALMEPMTDSSSKEFLLSLQYLDVFASLISRYDAHKNNSNDKSTVMDSMSVSRIEQSTIYDTRKRDSREMDASEESWFQDDEADDIRVYKTNSTSSPIKSSTSYDEIDSKSINKTEIINDSFDVMLSSIPKKKQKCDDQDDILDSIVSSQNAFKPLPHSSKKTIKINSLTFALKDATNENSSNVGIVKKESLNSKHNCQNGNLLDNETCSIPSMMMNEMNQIRINQPHINGNKEDCDSIPVPEFNLSSMISTISKNNSQNDLKINYDFSQRKSPPKLEYITKGDHHGSRSPRNNDYLMNNEAPINKNNDIVGDNFTHESSDNIADSSLVVSIKEYEQRKMISDQNDLNSPGKLHNVD